VDELSKLQDAMPADPLEEVEKLLSKESLALLAELCFGMVNFLLERILKGFQILSSLNRIGQAGKITKFLGFCRSWVATGASTLSLIQGRFLAVRPLPRHVGRLERERPYLFQHRMSLGERVSAPCVT